MTTTNATYPLRLPVSITGEAEKVAVLRTASYFTTRRDRADFAAFDRIMARDGGEPSGADDTIPA